jgi:hypothetical protein
MRVDGHVEDRPIWKLDLQTFQRFLGGYKIRCWDARDRWPTAQLPFLALRILLPARSFERSTHLGMLPECCTQHKPLKRSSWWNLQKLCSMCGGLKKNLAESEISGLQKLLLVLILHVQPVGWPGTEKNSAFAKSTA